jgi:hypothetical protein
MRTRRESVLSCVHDKAVHSMQLLIEYKVEKLPICHSVSIHVTVLALEQQGFSKYGCWFQNVIALAVSKLHFVHDVYELNVNRCRAGS